ncbi:UNVERIFIED_CONTAM: Retrovirus-related Pol polyprotein from transposon TNT 1-94 [Sesamum indicum]
MTKIPHFDGHYVHWSELMENLLRAKGQWSLIENDCGRPVEGTRLTEAQQALLDDATTKDYKVLSMRKDEAINEYFARVLTVSNKMRSNEEDMSDSKIIHKILRTLTKKFTYVVVSVEESKNIDNMSIDKLQSSLVVHEQKFRRVYNEDEDQVLKVDSGSGTRSRGRSSRGKGRGRGRIAFNKATYEFPKWNKEANYAEVEEDEDEDELLLMAYGSSMKTREGICSSLDTTFSHTVKPGNNTKMKVLGKGVVKLVLKGISYVIGDVYCVPELQNNLLSVGQLQEKGLGLLFKDEVCSIYHPQKGKMAESIMSANRMFKLITDSPIIVKEEKCLQISTTDQSKLWHHRYDHLSFKGLRTLQSKEMVVGLPPIEPLESNSEITTSSCRSMRSNYTCLQQPQETLVETELGMSIKCLRTDSGGEFNSAEFNDFCKQQGVKRQLTTTYTPQQNGVVERKNRTMMNLVRVMLSEKKVPKTFWVEAARWVIHALNRSPTLAVKDVTPEEVWSGEKPSVEHFRVFGYVGHVHIPDAKRTKLEDKSVNCVLLGVSDESKGYRMYDPVAKKIILSLDVVFDEDQWGDNTVITTNEEGEAVEDVDGAVNEAPIAKENLTTREGRIQHRPVWMIDYTFGEELSEDDEVNMTSIEFVVSSDLTSFEDVVKSSKWRLVMDEEIKSIEKNQT